MKYTIVVKFNNGKAKKSYTSTEMHSIFRILDKYPEAKEVIINGETVWKK